MTEEPGNYRAIKQRADLGDAMAWVDTLISAQETDTQEVLENCLYYLFQEGEATINRDELPGRIKGAIARIKGEVLDKEIELSLEDI